MKCQPMFELLKKDVLFIWTESCQRGFDYVKNEMTSRSPSMLVCPDYTKEFVLQMDAADKAIGFVLLQEQRIVGCLICSQEKRDVRHG